jgi:hypothetical protein
MTAKVKSVLTVASEAVETAAGYALVAVGLYAVLFVDMTGGGSLWKNLHHIHEVSQEGLESPNATRVVKVATLPTVEKVHEDRMMAVFDEPAPTGTVAAVYQAPDATGQRPSAALTDTPADPSSGKTWKRGLKGELRTFTVYGNGQQTTSASASVGTSVRAAAVSAPAVASAEGSPARSDTATAARPGMGSRLSRGGLSESETSRNIR